jgi:hypothetical protein
MYRLYQPSRIIYAMPLGSSDAERMWVASTTIIGGPRMSSV